MPKENGSEKKSEPIVACPACQKKTVYSTDNQFRPFCSQRCSLQDLSAWASEEYRVPVKPAETL